MGQRALLGKGGLWWGILRCAGKAGNPFQTTQGNRLSCRDPEGIENPPDTFHGTAGQV